MKNLQLYVKLNDENNTEKFLEFDFHISDFVIGLKINQVITGCTYHKQITQKFYQMKDFITNQLKYFQENPKYDELCACLNFNC